MGFVDGGWVSLVLWWLLANLMVDDGFHFYFDEWVLILLMVDEWWWWWQWWWWVWSWLWLMVEVVVVGAVDVF